MPARERLPEMNFIVTVEVRRLARNYASEPAQKVKLSPAVLIKKQPKNLLFLHKVKPVNGLFYLYLLIRAANLYRYACKYLVHQQVLIASLYW